MAGSQEGQPELNPETTSIPGQNASSETRKSSSKTSVRSKASKTSLKSLSSSSASLKKEASPEVQQNNYKAYCTNFQIMMFSSLPQKTESQQEKCATESQAANQIPKSSSKSSLKSKSSKSSLKFESGTMIYVKNDADTSKV